MNTFVMHLQSTTRYERIDDVASFVGEDDSGCFGILAGHGHAMTCLAFGLAQFRKPGDPWRYLAVPGAVLQFSANQLHLSARHYVHDADLTRIRAVLQGELRGQEQQLRGLKESAARLEEQLLRRLLILRRDG